MLASVLLDFQVIPFGYIKHLLIHLSSNLQWDAGLLLSGHAACLAVSWHG
jgi:hypothetical protein